MNTVSLLAIGSEVLDGRVADTNSNYICRRLSAIGIEVSHIHSCNDHIETIIKQLHFAVAYSKVIIITGGLGPTSDDLTREAVSEFSGSPLKLSEEALLEMKELYRKRGRSFNPINEKQAYFPEGASIIKNPVGTAPGFLIEASGVNIFCLPGVPAEMYAMFEQTVEPLIQKILKSTPLEVKGFKCFGLPEAVIGARIEALGLSQDIFVSYRAAFPEVHVALKASGQKALLSESHRKAIEAVGEEFIYTTNLEESYESYILDDLRKRKLTLGVAESCTGGMLGAIITNMPGSSDVFLGGVISYSNSAKEEILIIDSLKKYGAVSAETALAMAKNARKLLGSSIAVSITGVAGPGGGSQEKPVGLFYAALASESSAAVTRFFLPLKRQQIRLYACYAAIDLIRRELLELPKLPDASIPEK